MAVTNAQLIRDALGLIGILGEGEEASAEQGEHALRVLNEMMADWEQEGVNLEYYPQIDLGDATPIPSHAVSGVKAFLGATLAPYYGRPISTEFSATNQKFYDRLVRDAVKDRLQESSLDGWPGQCGSSNIFSG